MRIPGVGDWFYQGDTLNISASGETPDERFLIALHELVEAWLCRRAGVTQDEVDLHDLTFEAERAAGAHGEDDEPGDDPRAPYRAQHRAAMLVEHLMANFLGLSNYGVIR